MSLFNLLVSRTIMHVPGPIVGLFAKGYIAGEQLSDAVQVVKSLNAKGMMATIDILGEFIKRKEESAFFKDQCLDILKAIESEQLDANLSLKPTQMGLELDKKLAFDNIREIVTLAAACNNFVRIDMEDHPCTDDTLDFFRRLREEFPGHVGVVLQSYLRRTPNDIDALSDGPLNFRLCKGIYNEPRQVAYKDMAIINRSFVCCLEQMFDKKAYVGIATHDEKLVFEAEQLVRKFALKRDDYEFQMLLGVDMELRDLIVERGHRLRIYVPFGKSWLPYSKRRLKENPSIAKHALKQMLGMKRF